MLPARIRSESGWSDACILNISTRGLLVYSSGKALPGSFVEIRRGNQLVVARVVWRKNQRFGVWSPDPLHIEEIVSDRPPSATSPAATPVERRKIPRQEDRSRARARATEFLAIVLIATTLGAWAAFYVEQTLSEPIAAAHAVLSGR